MDDGGNAPADIVTSPHGLIANITVTYDVAPHVQLYANGDKHLLFEVRAGERLSDSRPIVPCRRAAAAVKGT